MRYAFLLLLLLPLQIWAQDDCMSTKEPIQPYAVRQAGDSVVLERDSMGFVFMHQRMVSWHMEMLVREETDRVKMFLHDQPFCYVAEQAHQVAWRQGFIDLLATGAIPANLFWRADFEREWQHYAHVMKEFGILKEGESARRMINIDDVHVLDTPEDALKCFVFRGQPIFGFSSIGMEYFGLIVETNPRADGLPGPSSAWRIVCLKMLWFEI